MNLSGQLEQNVFCLAQASNIKAIINKRVITTLLSSTSKVSRSPLVSPFRSVSSEFSYSATNRNRKRVSTRTLYDSLMLLKYINIK